MHRVRVLFVVRCVLQGPMEGLLVDIQRFGGRLFGYLTFGDNQDANILNHYGESQMIGLVR